MLNVFAVLGIAPVTGVPLPFVSYGASNLLVMLAAMGLLLNVAGGGAAHLHAVRSTRDEKTATIRGCANELRIAIAAGGTAGHVVPALAVADALRERGAEVLFIGGDRAERTLVPAAGYQLEQLAVSALDRRNPLRAARALWRAARALRRARGSCSRGSASTWCMGGGGYVAGPVALAAWTRRIPVVLTEADSHLGLTNRVLAPLAAGVCLAFPDRGAQRPRATA